MPNSKDILVGGLALVGGAALAKEAINAGINRTINNISYVLGQPTVGLQEIADGNLLIHLPITVLNSNEFSIRIDRFQGIVSYGNIPLGTIAVNGAIDLVSGQAKPVNLSFRVNISNTVQGVFNAAATGGLSALLEKIILKGNIYVFGNSWFGQISIPIETQIDIFP